MVPPPPQGIHWDQVCHDAPSAPPLPTTSSVFRVPEVVRGLVDLRREIRFGAGTVYTREVALSTEADSVRLRTLRGNVGGRPGAAMDSLLLGALRPDAPLSPATPLRVLVRANALPHVQVLPPLRCDPHRAHTGPSLRELEPGVMIGTVPLRRRAPPGRRLTRRLSRSTVHLEIRVDSAGSIIGVEVLRPSTDPAVTARAVELARLLEFHPALVNGRPVPAVVRRSLRFAADTTGGAGGPD